MQTAVSDIVAVNANHQVQPSLCMYVLAVELEKRWEEKKTWA